MKKFLALSMLLASTVFAVESAQAKTIAAPQQVRTGLRVQRNGRVARVVTQTRRVRVGGRIYRETYQTTYRPNGRVTTRVIRRTLVGRY